MSRTYKDRPYKQRFPEQQRDFRSFKIPYTCSYISSVTGELREFGSYWYQDKPGVLTKKKKEVNTDWCWMSTPMWHWHETSTVPNRRKGRAWERKVLFEDLEDTDPPDFSKKPKEYYW